MIDIFKGIVCAFKLPNNNLNETLKNVENKMKDILDIDVGIQLEKIGYSEELGINDGDYRIKLYTYYASEDKLNSWDEDTIQKLGKSLKKILNGETVVIQKLNGFNMTIN